jgi:DNA-binding transcriptional ArsR family regulator
MRFTRALLAISLTLIIVCSLAASIQRQKETDAILKYSAWTDLLCPSALTSPIGYSITATLAEKSPLPVNATRTTIFNFVSANPGVQFRAICSSLGLSIGVVQFHLAVLQKAGLVVSIRKGKYKRFFQAGKFSRRQMETIATLRLNTVRDILRALLGKQKVSHHELAVEVRISSQGLTWQMNRLRASGLVEETRDGLNVTYNLPQMQVSAVTQAINITSPN